MIEGLLSLLDRTRHAGILNLKGSDGDLAVDCDLFLLAQRYKLNRSHSIEALEYDNQARVEICWIKATQ